MSIRYPPLPPFILLNQTSPLNAVLEPVICVWFETIAIVPSSYFRTGNVLSADAALLATTVIKIAMTCIQVHLLPVINSIVPERVKKKSIDLPPRQNFRAVRTTSDTTLGSRDSTNAPARNERDHERHTFYANSLTHTKNVVVPFAIVRVFLINLARNTERRVGRFAGARVIEAVDRPVISDATTNARKRLDRNPVWWEGPSDARVYY